MANKARRNQQRDTPLPILGPELISENGNPINPGPKPLSEMTPTELRTELYSARNKRNDQRIAEIIDVLKPTVQYITIRVPIGFRDPKETRQTSIPRRLKEMKIPHNAGRAVDYLQLGMMDLGEKLENGFDVTTREKSVRRLFELINEQIQVALSGEKNG